MSRKHQCIQTLRKQPPPRVSPPVAGIGGTPAYWINHTTKLIRENELPTLYNTLADLILLVHMALVMFVLLGQGAILIGWARNWDWTRGVALRLAHLASIFFVMLETWFGVACPLTVLENHWRRLAGQTGYPASFIGSWLDRLLFYNAPDWLFTTVYTLFALAVLATFILYPPRFRHA